MPRGQRRARRLRMAMPGPSARSVRPAPPETVGARLQRSPMAPGTRRVHRRAPAVRAPGMHGAGEDRPSRRRQGPARSSRSRLDEPRRSMRSPSPRDHVSPGHRLGGRPRGRGGVSRPRRGASRGRAAPRSSHVRVRRLEALRRSHELRGRVTSFASTATLARLERLGLELEPRPRVRRVKPPTSTSSSAFGGGEARCAIESREYRRHVRRTGNCPASFLAGLSPRGGCIGFLRFQSSVGER